MGMYCCCGWKMTDSIKIDMVNGITTIYESDPEGCICDWNGWISLYDWPPERKNKDIPFSEPLKDGKYLVRIQDSCGSRYVDECFYSSIPRTIQCGYTGKDLIVHWSGNDEEQPYAWKDVKW